MTSETDLTERRLGRKEFTTAGPQGSRNAIHGGIGNDGLVCFDVEPG